MPKKTKTPRPRGRAANAIPCPGLAAERDRQGLSQERAAAALGVRRETWRSWETRGAAPADRIEEIAERWGVALEVLQAAPVADESAPPTAADLRRQLKLLQERLDELKSAFGRFLAPGA